MNKRSVYLVIVGMCLLLNKMAVAQSGEEREVANSVEQLRKAMVDADSIALDRVTYSELSYGHSTGRVEDKKSFIHSLMSGESDFVTIDLTDQTIKIAKGTAIVRHTLTGTTNDKGNPGNVKLAILTVWIKDNKTWKILARQAVRLQN